MNYCTRHHIYHDHHESCHRCDDDQYIVDVEWTIYPCVYIGGKLVAEYELDCVLTVDDRYDLQSVSIMPLLQRGSKDPVIIHAGSKGTHEEAIWAAAIKDVRQSVLNHDQLQFEIDERVCQQRTDW